MIQTSVLANGIHVISQALSGSRSAALGIWLINGTRHQGAAQSGYAHLIEHLLFKGTDSQSALQLSMHFDAMGGQINAHTGRELTALHGLVPGERLGELLHIFTDLFMRPAFTEQDLALEREVVFQEMAMVADTPDEAAEDHAVEHAWGASAMGEPILGRAELLRRAAAEDVHRYLRGCVQGARLRVVASGNVDHGELLKACAGLADLATGVPPLTTTPVFTAFRQHQQRSTAQAQLLWLMPIAPPADADHGARVVANTLLGGGLSSRLFQELREQRGLVYDVHSRLETYSDTGLWIIHTACETQDVAACRTAVEQVVGELAQRGPQAAELARAREHIGAGLIIESDDAEATVERLARDSLYLPQIPTVDDYVQQLNAVSADDVRRVLGGAWAQAAHLTWGP